MLGAGLGGFITGLQGGMNARANIDERKRTKVMEQRNDAEYDRATKQRAEIDGINTGAKAEFDKRVAAGTEKPDNFDTFWSNYALPKLKNTYLTQGNVDMANRVQAWGDSEDAKAGAKLAMSALTKAQTGDISGALSDATAAGKRKGYLAHGYEISGQDTIVDQSGKLQGYRLYMKGPDGKDIQQDLPLDQVPKLIATYLNPEAAWQSQIEAQSANAKRAAEISDYRTKKTIDKEMGGSADKSRSDAITALRKRMDGGLAGTDPTFDSLSRDEQEKMISDEIALQKGTGITGEGRGPSSGAPAAPGRKVLMDKVTGQPVAQQKAPQPQPQTSQSPLRVPAQPSSPEASRQDNMSYLLAEAEQALDNGVRPDRIAEELAANGIPEEAWPTSLKAAMTNGRRGVITGLGAR